MAADGARSGCPFVGPRPFEEAEALLFFGRRREIDELRALVTAHRVVLLYAQSGAGKSSLVQAGLIPDLRREGFEVLPVARTGGQRSARCPEVANPFVDSTIASWLGRDATSSGLHTIPEVLAARPRPLDLDGLPAPRLVVFDQLEEVFTRHAEYWQARTAFFEQVREALDDDPLLRVLFVIREEYIARLDSVAPLLPDRLRIRHHLELLRENVALEAIRGPLEAAGRAVDLAAARSLVRRLLETRVETEAGEPRRVLGEFVEPVQLQVVCQRLWAEVPTADARVGVGEIEKLGSLDEILAGFYVEGIRSAADQTRVPEAQLRKAFGTHFIMPDGARGFAHRDRERTAGIPNAAISVLEDRRLLRSEWRAGSQWYEIPHDALVGPILQSNALWNRERQKRARRRTAWVMGALGLAAVTCAVFALAVLLRPKPGEPRDMSSSISRARIERMAPLAVSFLFGNPSPTQTQSLTGTVSIKDPEGRTVHVFTVDAVHVDPGGTVLGHAQTLWAVLHPGEYTAEIRLAVGEYGFATTSLVFSASQPAPDVVERSQIQNITVKSLRPLTLAFRFSSPRAQTQTSAVADVTVTTELHQVVDRFAAVPSSDSPGVEVDATEHGISGLQIDMEGQGKYNLDRLGIYVAEVHVSLGDSLGVVSHSVKLEVRPIALPQCAAAGMDPTSGVSMPSTIGADELSVQPTTPDEDTRVGGTVAIVHQQPASWGLMRIHAPEAWKTTTGRSETIVAVIDSGVDSSLPQLTSSMWVNSGEIPRNGVDDDRNGYIDDINGWDFCDYDSGALVGSQISWQGTFIAGIIAARPGEIPVVGIAPCVKLMDVRVLDSNRQFHSDDWPTIARAIDYAVDNGARILCLCLSSSGRPPDCIENSLQRAANMGVITVGIAGNAGNREVMYLGKYETVWAVGATARDDTAASFTNRGPEVAFWAPGDGIASLVPGGGILTASGTSMAAAHVVGVAALVLSVAPTLSPVEVLDVLQRTAEYVPVRELDDAQGFGLPNAAAALRDVLGTPQPSRRRSSGPSRSVPSLEPAATWSDLAS